MLLAIATAVYTQNPVSGFLAFFLVSMSFAVEADLLRMRETQALKYREIRVELEQVKRALQEEE